MQLQKPLADDQPQPQKQRVARIAEVLLQAAHSVHISLLNDVGGVDPRLQPAVQAQLHHAVQPSPVPGENLVQRALVPGTGLFQKTSGFSGVVHCVSPHSVLTPQTAIYWTGRIANSAVFWNQHEQAMKPTFSDGRNLGRRFRLQALTIPPRMTAGKDFPAWTASPRQADP